MLPQWRHPPEGVRTTVTPGTTSPVPVMPQWRHPPEGVRTSPSTPAPTLPQERPQWRHPPEGVRTPTLNQTAERWVFAAMEAPPGGGADISVASTSPR